MVSIVAVGRAGAVGATLMSTTIRSVAPSRRVDIRRQAKRACDRAGVEVRIAGQPPTAGGLLCANHIGYVEIPALFSVTQMDFVGEARLAHWPVLGALMRSQETVFVDRSLVAAARPMVEAVEARLHAGRLVLCFPEGTPSASVTPGPFLTGIFEAAVGTGLPVIPVAISIDSVRGRPPDDRARELVSWHRDPSGHRPHMAAHLLRLCNAAPTVLTLRFGSPISVGDAGRKSLAATAHAAVTNLAVGSLESAGA